MNPPKAALKFRGAASRIVLAEQDRFLARDLRRLSGTNLNRWGGEGLSTAPGGGNCTGPPASPYHLASKILVTLERMPLGWS